MVNLSEDDRIMIKKNDYDKGLMNGMVGNIRMIERDKNNEIIGVNIIFEGDDEMKFIKKEEMENMDLGYIITIHKSQGSESENVIIFEGDDEMKFIKKEEMENMDLGYIIYNNNT